MLEVLVVGTGQEAPCRNLGDCLLACDASDRSRVLASSQVSEHGLKVDRSKRSMLIVDVAHMICELELGLWKLV